MLGYNMQTVDGILSQFIILKFAVNVNMYNKKVDQNHQTAQISQAKASSKFILHPFQHIRRPL